jgi:hypothetical protein
MSSRWCLRHPIADLQTKADEVTASVGGRFGEDVPQHRGGSSHPNRAMVAAPDQDPASSRKAGTMFARITPFKMKQGSRDEAMKIMEKVKSQILGLDGIQHFVCVMDDSGSGYVVSLVSSKEASDGNSARVKEIWANFSSLLEEPPVPGAYEVLADWVPEPA